MRLAVDAARHPLTTTACSREALSQESARQSTYAEQARGADDGDCGFLQQLRVGRPTEMEARRWIVDRGKESGEAGLAAAETAVLGHAGSSPGSRYDSASAT
jgi:hypothetical protein